MKKLSLILILFSLFSFGQQNISNTNSKKSTFQVSGVCDMCKFRIEKQSLKIKGVKFAKWDKYSNKLSIIYNPRKNILDSIQKQIAFFGHDTEKFTAPLNIYKNLPECCYYRDSSIH